MANRIEIIIDSVTKGLESGLHKSQSGLQKFSKAALTAGIALSAGLAVGLEKSVEAAMNAQKVNARLGVAFKNAGLNSTKYAAAVDKAEESSRKLGFTDEDTKNALGSLLVSTGKYTDSVRQLAIAQDLARFKSVSLEAATKAMTMAHAGSLRPLKQLGIDIPKVTAAQDLLKASTKKHTGAVYDNALAIAKARDKQSTFANVLDTVTAKVHGQAEAYAQTNAGGLDQFRAQTEHLQVILGTALLPALLAITQELSKGAEFMSKHADATKIAVAATAALAAGLISVSIGMKIYRAATVVATAAQWALNVAMDANPVGAIIVGVVALSAALVILQVKYHGVTAAVQFLTRNWWLLLVPLGLVPAAVALVIQKLGLIGRAVSGVLAVAHAFQTAYGWAAALVHGIEGIVRALGRIHMPSLHFPSIPHLAAGGIVNRPTIAMIGEKGPEAVVPLSGAGGASGMGATYVFNFPNYVGSSRELARAVRQEFVLMQKSGTRLGFT